MMDVCIYMCSVEFLVARYHFVLIFTLISFCFLSFFFYFEPVLNKKLKEQ
jgi:hypothetical protein